ncbi:MAG: hypothetical protein AAF458_01850 [Pseudomonadota bacterium]
MKPLLHVQKMLQAIYGLRVDAAIDDFLVTDRSLADRLHGVPSPRHCDEKLLVAADGADIAISLFLDEQVLRRLDADRPATRLGEHNLADFCTALEGVSHFLYVAVRAGQNRSVSLLELELQAEVDKYVGIHATLRSQGRAVAPRNLLTRLFHHFRFAAGMSIEERARYAGANRYAQRYCGHLERRFMDHSPVALMAELRHFYHLAHFEKLRHIEAVSAA